MHAYLSVYILVWKVLYVYASYGDRADPFYTECLKVCGTACRLSKSTLTAFESPHLKAATLKQTPISYLLSHSRQLSFAERALQWSCASDCRYKCMFAAVMRHSERGYFVHKDSGLSPIQQYHGKWPFFRLLGIQEPASTLFSAANMLPHIRFLCFLKSHAGSELIPFAEDHALSAQIAVLAWACAVAFHCRDTTITERMDYHSAFAYTLALFGTMTYDLFIFSNTTLGHPCIRRSLWMILCMVWITQVLYMNLVTFDYGTNMAINVGFSLLTMFLFILKYVLERKAFSFRMKSRNSLKHVTFALIAFMLNIIGATLFEVYFDFPPLFFILDAHAIWHFITIISTSFYYMFAKRELLLRLNSNKLDFNDKIL